MPSVAIIQPNYIPWRGYFDFIREVDLFVFLDDVQYTRRDWRNRNRIKLRDGSCVWLSVPVLGGRNQLISDVAIDVEQAWARKHAEALRRSYGRAPFFDAYFPELQELLMSGTHRMLVDLDIALIKLICRWLAIETPMHVSSDYQAPGAKDDKLLALVRAIGGTEYVSGPAARDYIRDELWDEAGISLRYKDYSGYPPYPQISEPFEPSVSVLDLLFMMGEESPSYIWGERRQRS